MPGDDDRRRLKPPLIWLLLSDKPGDNMQARLVAQATNLPFSEKQILMRDAFVLGKPRFRASLDHIDPSRSDPLEEPWPDAIITIGRRPSMVAFWIRQQAGGKTKIIQVGRAKRKLKQFDLVIAAPQFMIQDAPNALRLDLPLIRADASRIEVGGAEWRARLQRLPRPLTGLFVGGPTRPYAMPGRLIENAVAAIRNRSPGGTIYATTSRRTPPGVVQALERLAGDDLQLFVWSKDALDNPYQGLLAHGDRFAVTGDSISMMMEVADVKKPLAIIALPVSNNPQALALYLARRWARKLDPGGRFGSPRDLRKVHGKLIEIGAATMLDDGFPAPPFDGLARELEKVGSAVRSVVCA